MGKLTGVRIGVVLATLLASFVLSMPASAKEPVRLIVKVDGRAVRSAAEGTGGHFVKQIDDQTAVIEVSSLLAQEALERRDDVVWVEPDIRYRAADIPNDPCYVATCNADSQWQGPVIGAESAWSVTKGEPSMKIAIIDSGVNATHPDLLGHVEVGPNYSDEGTQSDLNGHGTHVAGIIGAVANNGIGAAGMVWNASLVTIKVLNQQGEGDVSAVAEALRWAADNGVRIANLSLGGGFSQAMSDGVAYAQARGVLIVASAGNDGLASPVYPAAEPGVLAVGATTQSNQVAAFSNFGTWVDIVAPGVNIASTWPVNLDPSDPYRGVSGTSMAAPMVAGAAALVWSERPYYSWSYVGQRLKNTATPIAGSGVATETGLLNVGAALSFAAHGYRMVASDGGIFAYNQPFHGSTGGQALNQPIVTGITAGNLDGYWLIARDGGVFSYGGAGFHGSTGGKQLNQPIVGATATRSGNGYWLVASDGGVFSFGDARFYGSTGGQPLNKPIVGIIPTVSGRGYWLIASDGGVFSYGDAQFRGSTGGQALNSPIIGGARTATGFGYWLIASDGGVFSFGDAQFHGSTGGQVLVRPIVGVVPSPSGDGYWLVASDGGVFAFDAPFYGSIGGHPLNQPVVGILS